MRRLAVGASVIALAAVAWPAMVASQDAGPAEQVIEVEANALTCAQFAEVETAAIPGILYFVAGYRAAGAADAEPGMADAVAAQEAEVAGEPGPATAGTEGDPAATDEAPDIPAEAEMAEPGDDADAPAGEEMAGPAEPGPDGAAIRVRGHAMIPIEQTVIACAQDPEALVADVIEAQIAGGAGAEAAGNEDATEEDATGEEAEDGADVDEGAEDEG